MADYSDFNEKKIEELAQKIIKTIIEKDKIGFDRNRIREIIQKIPKKPGVYIVFKENQPIYVGESRDIRARYKDMHNTLNHTLRRAIGHKISGEHASSKNKFSDKTETDLDNYFKTCEFGFMEVNFGRVELQDMIADLLCKKYSLHNKEIKRGRDN